MNPRRYSAILNLTSQQGNICESTGRGKTRC